MTTREKLTEQAAALVADAKRDDLIAILDELWAAARKAGADDLAIDLYDAEVLDAEGVEFAMENNGVADPRRAA